MTIDKVEASLLGCRFYTVPNIVANGRMWGEYLWTLWTTKAKVVRTLEDVVSSPDEINSVPESQDIQAVSTAI
jgi:hypothetical protein